MHLQIRCHPVKSPPDVARLLLALAEDGVDLAAAGGSNIEFGGELAFAPKDGQEDAAFASLDRHGYSYRVLEADSHPGLRLGWLDDKAGALAAFLETISSENLESGRIIRDLVLGTKAGDDEPGHAGQYPVHVYSEEIRTKANVDG